MRILGIDPGYSILGWAVIEHNLNLVDFGVITTRNGIGIDDKILHINMSLIEIIDKYKPDCASVEKLFFSKNTKTAIDVARCSGAVILTLKLAGLDLSEYTPIQVKRAITGYGRASKPQMQNIIQQIFRIKYLPEPDDAADALAIAACHSFCMANPIAKIQ